MPGSPTYTADIAIDATFGDNFPIFGSFSVANSATTVTGFGTLFNTELQIGDTISFTTDNGSSITRIVESISSNTSLELSTAVGASDISTKTQGTRKRGKLQGSNKNISIFKLPNIRIKTLKTTTNSGLTDTNFNIRRHFTATLSSGSATITAGTNETFAGLTEKDYSVSVMTSSGSATAGDVLSITGNNANGNPIFTLGGSPVGKTLTLDFASGYSSAKITILANG
jgi:hypothetical protein